MTKVRQSLVNIFRELSYKTQNRYNSTVSDLKNILEYAEFPVSRS